MGSPEILRHIDAIARDKEIDPEELLAGVEEAVRVAVSKKYGLDDLELSIDRSSGKWECNYDIALEDEGRILAQAVKQAIIGRVREAERDVVYAEYEQKLGEIVNGTVQRFEGDTTIVNLGRNIEGILPRSEKVRGEIYNIGDRIRAMVFEVKKVGSRVKVILSRAHRDLVRCLFELEVPEIGDGIISIRRIEREPGYRTKLAVHSTDVKVDCVGACVGVRGTRIKSIIDELNGERIDIIRWNEDPEALIVNALKPAEISHIELGEGEGEKKALVLVDEDQLSLAIGRKGQNVRLASKMTGWEIDIMTRSELEQSIAAEEAGEALPAEGAEGEAAAAEPDAATEASTEPTNPESPETEAAAPVEQDPSAEAAAEGTEPAPEDVPQAAAEGDDGETRETQTQ